MRMRDPSSKMLCMPFGWIIQAPKFCKDHAYERSAFQDAANSTQMRDPRSKMLQTPGKINSPRKGEKPAIAALRPLGNSCRGIFGGYFGEYVESRICESEVLMPMEFQGVAPWTQKILEVVQSLMFGKPERPAGFTWDTAGVKVNDNRHYMATLNILVTKDSNVQGCWSDAAEEWALCVGMRKRVQDEFKIFKTCSNDCTAPTWKPGKISMTTGRGITFDGPRSALVGASKDGRTSVLDSPAAGAPHWPCVAAPCIFIWTDRRPKCGDDINVPMKICCPC